MVTEKKITCIELNHRNTPIAIREKLSLNNVQVTKALHILNKKIKEVFILSTCNRFSVYAYAEDAQAVLHFFQTFGSIKKYLDIYEG
ncbi:MAG: hypothetical protein IIA88_12035, partial [Bacteroidetes bacterium]|nr:hypothetical protein [Bacteroidota bacterium]